MKKKIETKLGKQIYSLRKIIVESVIGNIKLTLDLQNFWQGDSK